MTEPLLPPANPHLFGHAQALETLVSAYHSGRMPHAWIIAGARGSGKATLAYRFARFVLSGGETLDLSPEDPIFRRIAAGSHADLLAIEPAYDEKKEEQKNDISVDQARGIAEFLSKTAGEGAWRVVIVDAADALNANAANAILKILEEPPPQALLLLVSHNPARLLPTIRSRCRMLKLPPLSGQEFAQVMDMFAPDLSPAECHALAMLSGAAPGLALMLHEREGLALYEKLVELLSPFPQLDPAALQRFGEGMGFKQVHAQWQVFTQLMLVLLSRVLTATEGEIVSGEAAMLSRLRAVHSPKRWADLYSAAAEQFSVAKALHLDYKTVLVTFFHSLSAREAA